MDAQKKQLLDKIQAATNILVTVSSSPSVDQLAAAIGLSLMLNKLDKHATAVFSGEVPSTMEFLRPQETLEKDTNSLRDFIIALDKSKADKLRYKVEDKVVKIFITPYRTSLTKDDLEFSEGDFNVELVIALGVREQTELDEAITSHGRILHDATVTTVSNGDESHLGSINWRDTTASSLSELITELSKDLGKKVMDGQIATALLTGIVAATDRFRNEQTSAKTMSISADLMSAGANQQLVTSELEHTLEVHDQPAGDQSNQGGDKLPEASQLPTAVDDQAGKPAELDIDHGGQPADQAKGNQDIQAEAGDNKPPAIPELPELPKPMPTPADAKTSEELPPFLGSKPEHDLPQIRHVRADTDQNKEPEPYDIISKRHDMVSAPNLESPMSANSKDQDGDENNSFDPLTGGPGGPPTLLSHNHSSSSPKADLPLPSPLPDEPMSDKKEKTDDKPAGDSAPVDLPTPWNPPKDEPKPEETKQDSSDQSASDAPSDLPSTVPEEPKPEPPKPADTAPPAGDSPKADEPKPFEPPKPTIITPDKPPLPPMPQFGPVPPVPPIPASPFQPPVDDTPKSEGPKPPEPPQPPPAGQSLADLEKEVKSKEQPAPADSPPDPQVGPPPTTPPPMPSVQPPAPAKGNDVDAARDEVMRALSEQPDDAMPPIMALNAQPMGPEALHQEAPQPAAPAEPAKTDPLAPTGTPPESPSPADRPLDMPMPGPGGIVAPGGLTVPPPQIQPPTNSSGQGPSAPPPPPVPPPMMPPPAR